MGRVAKWVGPSHKSHVGVGVGGIMVDVIIDTELRLELWWSSVYSFGGAPSTALVELRIELWWSSTRSFGPLAEPLAEFHAEPLVEPLTQYCI